MPAPRQIASLNFSNDRVADLLTAAASGDDSAVIGMLQEAAGDEFGADEFGAITDEVAALAQAVSESGADLGEVGASLDQLIQAAASGDEFGADEFGARRTRGRGRRPNFNANNFRRGLNTMSSSMRRPGGFALPPALAAAAPAFASAAPTFTRDFQRVLERSTKGEGPHCPLPINLPGGYTGVIGAGASATITVTPPKDFVLQSLVIPRHLTDRFIVTAINVENDSLLSNTGFLPADVFAADSRKGELPRRLVRGGRSITIAVQNISGADSQFWGAFIGDEGETEARAR